MILNMKILKVVIPVMVIAFSCCNPLVTTKVIKSYSSSFGQEKFTLFNITDSIPSGAEKLGSVNVGDGGLTTNCEFEYVLELAKYQAKKIGGNALKITEHKPPSFGNTCHRIKADIYRIGDANLTNNKNDSSYSDVDTTGQITLHFFRPKSYIGSAVIYKVHVGDTAVWVAKNNSTFTMKFDHPGFTEIWAETESKNQIMVELEQGHEYYIKCEVATGEFVGIPSFQLMKYDQGKFEYSLIK
jgi:hypothetical protein